MMSVRRGIESLVCFILGTVGVPIASCAGQVGTRVSGATILAVTNVSGDGRLLAPTSAIDCGSGVVCLADPRSGLWRLDLVTGAMTLIGRVGEGPGEYRMPRLALSWIGDTVALWDPALRRVTLFPLGHGRPRVQELASQIADSLLASVAWIGTGPQSLTVLSRIAGRSRESATKVVSAWSVLWQHATSSPRETKVLLSRSLPRSIIKNTRTMTYRADAPLRPILHAAMLANGVTWAGVSTEREFRRIGPAGEAMSSVHVVIPQRQAVPSDRNAYRDSILAHFRNEAVELKYGPRVSAEMEDVLRRFLKEVPWPSAAPLWDILVPADSTIWIGGSGTPGIRSRIWRQFGANGGAPIRQVRVPHKWAPIAAIKSGDTLRVLERSRDGDAFALVSYLLAPRR